MNTQNSQAKKKGFTLVEIVIAMVIFAFTFLAIIQTQYYAIKAVAFNRTLSAATSYGQIVADSLEALGINSLGDVGDVDSVVYNHGNRDYTAVITIAEGGIQKAAKTVEFDGVNMKVGLEDGSPPWISKRVEVEVKWLIGNHPYSTTVSTEVH